MAQPPSVACFLFASLLVAHCASAAAALLPPAGNQYIVGGPDGWGLPPPGNVDLYSKWASAIHFYVGDSIEFVYKNDSVVRLDKFGYYHCNVTVPAGVSPVNDGSALFVLDAPGFAYFSCADVKHCKKGQRLAINVETRPTPAPAPTEAAAAMFPPAGAPQEQAIMSAAAALTSPSSGHAFVLLVCCATVLALMGLTHGA